MARRLCTSQNQSETKITAFQAGGWLVGRFKLPVFSHETDFSIKIDKGDLQASKCVHQSLFHDTRNDRETEHFRAVW